MNYFIIVHYRKSGFLTHGITVVIIVVDSFQNFVETIKFNSVNMIGKSNYRISEQNLFKRSNIIHT